VILKDVVDGKAESAAAWDREGRAVKNNDVIDFKMGPMGGFVAMFSEQRWKTIRKIFEIFVVLWRRPSNFQGTETFCRGSDGTSPAVS